MYAKCTLYKLKLNIIKDIFINRLMLICWTINVVRFAVCYCYLFNKCERNPKRQSWDTVNIGHTWHKTKTNKTHKHNTTQKTKTMSNMYPTKIRRWTQVLAKCQQPLLLKSHPPCNSYILYIVKLDKSLVNLLKLFLTTWVLVALSTSKVQAPFCCFPDISSSDYLGL